MDASLTVAPDANVPKTVNDVFLSVVDRDLACVMQHKVNDAWKTISSRELYQFVAGVSHVLQKWGICHGDRIAILSENRPEWAVADFASLFLGAITVPIYPTLTPEQIAYMLKDSAARVVFVSTEIQLKKVLAIQKQTQIEHIVIMDANTSPAESMAAMMQNGPQQRDFSLDVAAQRVKSEDVATLIYTSGTTGVPKGVLLTHGNMTSNLVCSMGGFNLGQDDISLSFLPLSHITARHVDLAVLFRGASLAYVGFVEQLTLALQEIHPTFLVGVPRVYEKVHASVEEKARHFPGSLFYPWACRIGEKHLKEVLAGNAPRSLLWKLANKRVYSKIRAGMGGKVKFFVSGGAPLGRDLARWYALMGIRLHEGYGLTETSPVIAVNTPGAHKLGTVGKPLWNVEVRIADDGEILVRGPSIFKGYWNNPAETANAFIDGWFKTGDIGNLDEEGFLSITDRKKDLIKTSGGKFIAPQPLENSLKHNALITEAVVIGEKRKFPAVLIVPSFRALEEWARGHQIPFSGHAELVSNPKVQALYEEIVESVNRNLARFERLKKVILLAEEFSVTDGTLTASMKLRRRVVEDRYRERIDAMYREADQLAATT
ncbi:MAG TPA: long-chain fatty acid--CoA ligase [Terriglobales bacterium]|nr:long-chain fatty acid--CoA ligase [Terriglobales bacterium]